MDDQVERLIPSRSGSASYEVVLGQSFRVDLQRLSAAARRDPSGRLARLRREVVRTVDQLREGESDGHHPLGFEPGKGDLRDCVTAYVRADPQEKATHRLVFREIGPAQPGGTPRRELLAVKPRQGPGNVYEHVCARLRRHPADRQPGLNRFGDRAPGDGGNQSQRQSELDTKRAIAHAWAGQRPLATSRPLRGTPRQARAPGPTPAIGRLIGSPGGTGWPERA
ncbi:hypothetical protein GCM10009741_03180 [Kribbella lupini]|uniref:Uncharacterized protein n=1 Tax=Kribbella lupini TaxID=291602 RepID=A0ABN2A2F8_9ACTN